jgi:hypothetical protein
VKKTTSVTNDSNDKSNCPLNNVKYRIKNTSNSILKISEKLKKF